MPGNLINILERRHAAFLTRLDALTPNAANAVPAVSAAIRSYRASESGPRDVISTLFEVVDRDLDTTARLISLLVELLDDEDKRRALLSAWNGFKLEVIEKVNGLMLMLILTIFRIAASGLP